MYNLTTIFICLAYLTIAAGKPFSPASPSTHKPHSLTAVCQAPVTKYPARQVWRESAAGNDAAAWLENRTAHNTPQICYTPHCHHPHLIAWPSAIIVNTGNEYPTNNKQPRRIGLSDTSDTNAADSNRTPSATVENHLHKKAFRLPAKYYFLYYLHRLRI